MTMARGHDRKFVAGIRGPSACLGRRDPTNAWQGCPDGRRRGLEVRVGNQRRLGSPVATQETTPTPPAAAWTCSVGCATPSCSSRRPQNRDVQLRVAVPRVPGAGCETASCTLGICLVRELQLRFPHPHLGAPWTVRGPDGSRRCPSLIDLAPRSTSPHAAPLSTHTGWRSRHEGARAEGSRRYDPSDSPIYFSASRMTPWPVSPSLHALAPSARRAARFSAASSASLSPPSAARWRRASIHSLSKDM